MNQQILEVVFNSNYIIKDYKMLVEGMFINYDDNMNISNIHKIFIRLQVYLDKEFNNTFDKFTNFIEDILVLYSSLNDFNRFVSSIHNKTFNIAVALFNHRLYRATYNKEFSWDNIDDNVNSTDFFDRYSGYYNLKNIIIFNDDTNKTYKNSLLSLKNISKRTLFKMLQKARLKNCINHEYYIEIEKTLHLKKEVDFFVSNIMVLNSTESNHTKKQ